MGNRDVEQFTTTGWPWRTGNSFVLLDDGGEFFPAMLAAIDAAAANGQPVRSAADLLGVDLSIGDESPVKSP